jgi:hypothetical protein
MKASIAITAPASIHPNAIAIPIYEMRCAAVPLPDVGAQPAAAWMRCR